MTEYLEDGFATYYTFSEAPSLRVKEVDTTPPGLDAGGAIDQTTMRNTRWRTSSPKSLVTMTDGKATVAYDPVIYEDMIAMLGVNQLITVTFPDGDTVQFWGFINKFQPTGHKEGDRPTADFEVIPTNLDDDQVETGPEYAAAP